MVCYNCENEDVYFAFQYKDDSYVDINKHGLIISSGDTDSPRDVNGLKEGMSIMDKNLLDHGNFHDVEGYCNYTDEEGKGCDDYVKLIVQFENGEETSDYKQIAKRFFGFDLKPY